MNQVERASLEIIKEIMNHIPADVPENMDWKEIYREFQGQSFLPLTYSWMKKHANINIEESLKTQWLNSMYFQISQWHNMMHQQNLLVQLFEENGYDIAIMKGNTVGAYYPKAELRSSSDIDFLVRWEKYDDLCQFMMDHGYQMVGEKVDREHHVAFRKSNVSFEMHKRPGGTRYKGTDAQKELVEYYKKSLDRVEHIQIGKYKVPVLDPVANGLLLMLHTAGHMKTGIGLRHLLDWMVFVEHFVTDDFWQEQLEPMARKAQVDQLAKTMARIAQRYLGMSDTFTWCKDVPDPICDDLLHYFMEQGDLGYKAGTEENEIELYEECTSLRKFLKRLNYSSLYSMPAARKHVLLRPIAWIYQMFRYVRKGLKKQNPMGTMMENRKVAKERRGLFESVGLDWM